MFSHRPIGTSSCQTNIPEASAPPTTALSHLQRPNNPPSEKSRSWGPVSKRDAQLQFLRNSSTRDAGLSAGFEFGFRAFSVIRRNLLLLLSSSSSSSGEPRTQKNTTSSFYYTPLTLRRTADETTTTTQQQLLATKSTTDVYCDGCAVLHQHQLSENGEGKGKENKEQENKRTSHSTWQDTRESRPSCRRSNAQYAATISKYPGWAITFVVPLLQPNVRDPKNFFFSPINSPNETLCG